MPGHSRLQMTRRHISALSHKDMTKGCRTVDPVYKLVSTKWQASRNYRVNPGVLAEIDRWPRHSY